MEKFIQLLIQFGLLFGGIRILIAKCEVHELSKLSLLKEVKVSADAYEGEVECIGLGEDVGVEVERERSNLFKILWYVTCTKPHNLLCSCLKEVICHIH
jgi:hypothetical protein